MNERAGRGGYRLTHSYTLTRTHTHTRSIDDDDDDTSGFPLISIPCVLRVGSIECEAAAATAAAATVVAPSETILGQRK